MNGRERFLGACRGEAVDRVPVWLMRQAGRYLPEYRALRKRHTILELARTPELAAEVALQPMRAFDLDAAILFADIVLPLQAMGAEVDLPDGVGPLVARPVRTLPDVDRLRVPSARSDLGFVLEAIQRIRETLGGARALIGFAGAPFTLASYLIEGRPSREFLETKRFMHTQPQAWRLLMDCLTETTVDYLRAQAAAGADAVQLFDSWAGHLSPADYRRHVAPWTQRVFQGLGDLGVPRIHFATPAAGILPELAALEAEVLGVDWRIEMSQARRALPADRVLQGNLDPGVLANSWDAAREATEQILRATGGVRHIFNLGHGVLPSTPPEHVRALVALVHAQGVTVEAEARP